MKPSKYVSPRERHFWVVSPNVKNDESTVGEWRNASVSMHAAFMGYEPDYFDHDRTGPKFAGEAESGIMHGDVVLIARRHDGGPQVVGFGVVYGAFQTKLKGFKPPQKFGSLRRLSPFIVQSRAPSGIPLKGVLRHTKALVQLHPKWDTVHKEVCDWMEKHLGNKSLNASKKQRATTERKGRSKGTTPNAELVDLPENYQLDYKIQTKAKRTKAVKFEAKLLGSFKDWLKKQGRKLSAAKYGALRCDGYEIERGNLIEAKSSARREHIRMAVGQLLDYAFQGKQDLGEPKKAILLPVKPQPEIEKWLASLEISIIWRKGREFLDNANGQFA
jgi:hypothetical protein